jgi:tetratricopeptide (TPR) repeat protein
MRYAILCVCAVLLLLAVPSAPAQQVPASAAATPDSTANSTLSPRQTAELRADILMARKEYFDAVRAYDQILKNEPNNAELLNKMGVAYQELIDLNRAEHYYKKAMKADKAFASAINNVGTVEYEKKHYGKAVGYYRKALALRTDMATIYTNLGYAYMEDKKYPEAMGAFSQALEIDPTVFDRKGGNGAIVQQRTTTDPGLFYFFVAKSYALAGDAERAAHYLKLSRDDGYKDFATAAKDPAFAKVIKDPRVQEVLTVVPSYAADGKKPATN